MSIVSVFQCDGPSCLRSDDEAVDEFSLMQSGWMIISLIDGEEERFAHFCSYKCLEQWARAEGS